MSLEVICPLTTLVEGDSSVLNNISKFSIDLAKQEEIVPFIRAAMEEEAQTNPPPEKKVKKTAAKAKPANLVTARQLYSEMRKLDKLECDTVLTNGERVGEFLLQQWLIKEGKKKPSEEK